MFCQNCGEKINDGVKFCSKCGTQVSTIDEPENILLKAMVTAEQEYPSYAMNNGNLIITNKRVVFTSSRLLNVDLLGSADSDLSIYYNEIAEFRSTTYNLVFPAIEITTKDGFKIKFGGFGKIKIAYRIMCEKMNIKNIKDNNSFAK